MTKERLKEDVQALQRDMKKLRRDAYQDVKQRAVRARDKVDDTVHAHPYTTLGAAFGVGAAAGVLTGWLIRR